LRERLQRAAELDLGDGCEFLVEAPRRTFDAPPDGGARYPVEVRMDSRRFARFSIDVGLGDVILTEADRVTGPNHLGFAGIQPATVALLPVGHHLAEKFHALTLPRASENSRVRDLADIVFLLARDPSDADAVAVVAKAVFERRGSHEMPAALPVPPSTWGVVYEQYAAEYELREGSLEAGYAAAAAYWSRLVAAAGSCAG
jgi:hypothetical protein